jgi:hypothetical protein
MLSLAVLLIAAGGLWAMWRSMRRFAAEQRRLGRWDENGPLVETAPPPRGEFETHGGGMDERREVIGEWHGQVLSDRRPDPPHDEH